MDKEIALSVRLEDKEVEDFDRAKSLSGIRSNSEFIRFLINFYLSVRK